MILLYICRICAPVVPPSCATSPQLGPGCGPRPRPARDAAGPTLRIPLTAHACADCGPFLSDAPRSIRTIPLHSWLVGSSSRFLDGDPLLPRPAQSVHAVVADQEKSRKKSHLFLRAPAGAQTRTHPSTPTGRSLPTPQRPHTSHQN